MAVSKQAVRNALKGYYEKGMNGEQALSAIENRKDAIGESYREAIDKGMTKEQFANTFHINVDTVNNDAGFLDKAKSTLASIGMGMADKGAGILQGVAYAGDKVNEGINSVLGTKLETHAYDKYNDTYKKANQATETYRHDAGRSGTDLIRGGTGLAMELPFYAVGGGGSLAARMATQGVIGAGIAGASYADDSKQRAKNVTSGFVGAAVGQGVGEKIIAPVIGKTYNAIKGNIKPDFKPLEDIAKKYNVRTSAGDISRNPIIKKSEVSTEYIPMVGMSSWREAQHGEAKAAAQKVADGTKSKMIETNFKDLPKIQQAATRGDRNAARILKGIEESGDDHGKILQSSMEVRSWREKQIASKLYDKVGEELKKVGNTNVSPNNTKALLSGKLDELSKSLAPDDVLAKDLQKIKNAFDNPNVTKDFGNMRLLRSQLGEMGEKYATMGTNPNKAGAKFLGDLRQAVEKDISDFVANSGNNAIKTAYNRADRYYRNIMEKQDKAFAKAMDSNKPDEIYAQFIRTGKGDRAANFYNALDQKGQAALRYAMVDDALSKASNDSTGHFSPAKFAGEFERMQAPYSKIFNGTDKAEMDGFVKLMRHVDRAGQYMENPANGNRVANMMTNGVGAVAVGLPTYANAAGVTLLAKTLFTSKAGKNLLLAASKLEPEATGMANILKAVESMTKASSANVDVENSTTIKTDEANTTESPVNETSPFLDNPPNSATPVINEQMPTQQSMQLATNERPQSNVEVPQIQTMQSEAQPMIPSKGEIDQPSGHYESSAQSTPNEAINSHIGNALQSIIPPPKESDNPQKMAAYEQVSDQAIGAILQTTQMQKIVTELESETPNDSKIQSLQKSLSKTPEWQAFLQTLPKREQKTMNGADVLSLITRNSKNQEKLATPQF